MAHQKYSDLKCGKTSIFTIHSLSLLFEIIFTSDKSSKDSQSLTTICILVYVLIILFKIIGLIAIIKENKSIVYTFLVLSILALIGNMIRDGMDFGILDIVIVLLTGYYAYMINKNDDNVI